VRLARQESGSSIIELVQMPQGTTGRSLDAQQQEGVHGTIRRELASRLATREVQRGEISMLWRRIPLFAASPKQTGYS
jgi:hypothetical protein